MRAPLSTAIAIAAGIVVLLGYFLPVPEFKLIRSTLIEWAVIVAGIAGLIAIIHLVKVHIKKLNSEQNRDYYSLITLIAFFLTLAAGLWLSPSDSRFQQVVTSIQMPIEASLMGVMAISLTFASIRLFQRRKGWMPIIFAVSAIVFLILASGFLSIADQIPLVKDLLSALNMLPVAGARGILLGIALGSLTTGLRILLAADRPYSG